MRPGFQLTEEQAGYHGFPKEQRAEGKESPYLQDEEGGCSFILARGSEAASEPKVE